MAHPPWSSWPVSFRRGKHFPPTAFLICSPIYATEPGGGRPLLLLVEVTSMSNVIQFDWRQHWKERVEPHLGLPLVRRSVEVGMKLYDPAWTWEDGPHAIGRGRCNGQRVVRGKLSWYQPWGRCHWISFCACAIGVLNYPEL